MGELVGGIDFGKIVDGSAEPSRPGESPELFGPKRRRGGGRRAFHFFTGGEGAIFMLRSAAGAEWVSAPTEMKSTPVAATSRRLSRSMPPEASTQACLFTSRTASAISRGFMLSSMM